jgi:hypothetical protein
MTMQIGPWTTSNSSTRSLVAILKIEDAGETAGGGRRRHVDGDGVVGEHREARAHLMGYQARREAIYGGAAMAAGGGDGSGTVAAML